MVAKSTFEIAISEPRTHIRVTLPTGDVLEAPVNTPIMYFLEANRRNHPQLYNNEIMGGILNGRLRELAYEVQHDSTLAPVLHSTSDGGRIYRRSLTLLLTAAVDEVFPGVKVGVKHSIPEGGYYCELRNREPFTPAELEQLSARMHAIAAADEPITKRVVPLTEALSLFQARQADDKLRLLEQRTRDDLTLYQLRSRTDYYFGYMLPSTKYLTDFWLTHTAEGFILRFPRSDSPTELQTETQNTKLTDIFRETNKWLQVLGVEDIGRLNHITRAGRSAELILVAEALHEKRVAYIAEQIYNGYQNGDRRVVLIAGPSASGKTTFAKRLAVQLLASGLRPFALELDNYFVDRDATPRDASGEYDFEALGALNVARFNEDLLKLTAGQQVQLPRFDFISGKSVPGIMAQLDENQVLIIEGIHGLNPELVPSLPQDTIYRVYVSALTQVNVDAHNRVPTTDVRLLRRIVRDARNRGYTATDTLQRWGSVRRGEKRNIFPHQENADIMFNSALVYELTALRPLTEPLLRQVKPNTPAHIEANRLLSFLGWVRPLSKEEITTIPDTSLLREFIGGSNLEHYHPDTLSG